jgi:hypothetical protein
VRGVLKGRRTFAAADGRVFEGKLTGGLKFYGKGVLRHRDGTVEEGEWVEGELTGRCRVTHPDGRVVEGEFLGGDCYQGQGVMSVSRRGVSGRWSGDAAPAEVPKRRTLRGGRFLRD